MARLIDTLRATRAFQMPVWVAPRQQLKWQHHVRNVAPLLGNPDLQVVQIDNVADYYYHGSDQEYWDIREDFPNLAPPWPAFWMEHKMMTHIHSKEKGTSDIAGFLGTHGRIGTLIHAIDPADVNHGNPVGLPEGTRWILWGELFIDYGRRDKYDRPTGPHDSVFFAIDRDGRLLERPWAQSFAADEDAEFVKALMTWFHPALLAMTFLHCKNVQVTDNTVDKPLAKKWREKTGLSPVRYKTLVIEPLRQILRHEGGVGKGNGLAKAMHICRGHFRDYREGRGLFGKYHQMVWTPQLVRGTRGKKAPPREIEVRI